GARTTKMATSCCRSCASSASRARQSPPRTACARTRRRPWPRHTSRACCAARIADTSSELECLTGKKRCPEQEREARASAPLLRASVFALLGLVEVFAMPGLEKALALWCAISMPSLGQEALQRGDAKLAVTCFQYAVLFTPTDA